MEWFLLACVIVEGVLIRTLWFVIRRNAIYANESFVNITKAAVQINLNTQTSLMVSQKLYEKIQAIEEKQGTSTYIQ